MALRFTLNPAWPQYAGVLSLLVRALCWNTGDPYHCDALANRGTWLDGGKKQWQPDGCMLNQYTSKQSAGCLRSRDVVFIGDSVTRKLYFQFAHTLDASLPTKPTADEEKHQDYALVTLNKTRVDFYWDPFLNGTNTKSILGGLTPNRTSQRGDRPALLVLGSGLWYLRYASESGGIPAWGVNMDSIFTAFTKSKRQVADSVIMLPVEQVTASKLSPERASTMHPSDIDAMNSDLFHRIHPASPHLGSSPSLTPIHLPLVFNKMLDPAKTEDGIHYSDSLIKSQASILLNLRCNDALPKQFPLSKTCCNRYPTPNIAHGVILFLLVLSIPVLVYLATGGDIQKIISAPFSAEYAPYLTMSAGLLIVYVADRSWLWLKEHKSFNPWTFTFLSLAALGAGLLSIRRADNDLGFLNRDQTDEWKGWMQIAILIYHYLGASKVSGIYNPIRVLVASYLFMTGYGHTTFYLRKADFGFLRIAQVLVRINLLTILLAYTMNTDYISYYFSPLVSMWFLIIYATMGVGAKYNNNTPFLLGKITASGALFTWLMREKWPLETLFAFLEKVFKIHWSAREWSFRVELDLWIVFVGMLASIAVIKIREHRLTDDHRWPIVQKAVLAASVLAAIWFFVFELMQESKFTYNKWHPFISFIPVLAFVFLRNANVILRSASSSVFAFVGKCSLETFILQYHFWLAGDTRGVLLVIPGTHLRPLNFVLTSIMFIYLSDRMAWATGEITNRICAKPKAAQAALPLPNTVAMEARPFLNTRNADNTQEEEEEGQELEVPPRSQALRALKDQDGTSTPIPFEPDTPIRPRRWIDRLAEVKPASKPSEGVWVRIASFFTTLKGHLLFASLVMWLLNSSWTYP
ncbi:O-acetyltransferase [Ephemerocybe angulata]|uniref:O-acetyltransferase n=1 Tax=Ephemerocybe angulata TaxID=980116 RepID=A0A8H6II58_9AGAR|nr:O-acetyltransferase [Tulosesus angulatus]